MGFGAGIFAGLFGLFFLTAYSIPCSIDPTDCSGRDIGMYLMTLPTSGVLVSLSILIPETWFRSIAVQMFFVFVSGVIQYGAFGVLVGALVHWVCRKIKKVS